MQAVMKQESVDTTLGNVPQEVKTNGTNEVPLKDMKGAPLAPKEECPIATPTGNVEVADEDLRELVKEVMYWQQPMLSGKIFFTTAFFYYATLDGGYNPVNLICYTIILRLLSVTGSREAAKWMEKSEKAPVKSLAKMFNTSADYIQETFQFPSVEQVSFVVKSLASTVEKLGSSLAQALLKAETSFSSLKVVVAHLSVLVLFTSIFSIWTMLFVGTLLAMSVPVLYTRNQEKIDPVLQKLKEKSSPLVEKGKAKGSEILGKAKAKGKEIGEKLLAKYKERMDKSKPE